MNRQRIRLLFILLCTLLLCSFVQATILQISVQDSLDNSTIPRATVFLNGENYARTNNNGQVFLNHSGLEDPLIRVSMTGYDDWEKLVDRNATSLLVNLSQKSIKLKVNIYDSDTLGSISGVQVNVSSDHIIQTKLTDISGSVTFDVNATTLYALEITAPNYQSRSAIIEMGTEDVDAQYLMLQTNQFSFVIKDKNGMMAVPDAEVYIDSALVGKTDSRGILTIPVVRGKVYTFDIKKGGYENFTETREIGQTDALYPITFSKARVSVFLSVLDEHRAPIIGADVYINGTLSGTTNQYGRLNFPDFISGPYHVEVRKPGYLEGNRSILVTKPNEDFIFEIPFEKAVLTLFVQEKDENMVSNATILLNGQILGVTDDQGVYRTRVKFNTLYNITAIKETYQTAIIQKQFDQGNATVSVTLVMEKSVDWALIIIIVIGALGVLIAFAAFRLWGGRKRRRVVRRNEI